MKLKKFLLGAFAVATALSLASCEKTDPIDPNPVDPNPVDPTPEVPEAEKGWYTTVKENYACNTFYISPTGKKDAAGTKEDPYSIEFLMTGAFAEPDENGDHDFESLKIQPGDTIYLMGGTYVMKNYRASELEDVKRITLNQSGTHKNIIKLLAYNDESVTIDFTGMNCLDANRGIQVVGDNWYIRGIDVKRAGDNGMYIAGSYNTVDNCRFYENQDTGLQLGRASGQHVQVSQWPHNNLIKNCTSYNNYDPVTLGENADGFAAKLTVGEANVFDGCIAYRNSDDGWDLFAKADSGNVGTTVIKNCVAFENGWIIPSEFDLTVKPYDTTYANGDTPNGDGNGFKLGGSNMAGNVICENCMAFNNKLHGVTDNSNPEVMSLKYITSFNNSVSVKEDGTVGPNSNTSNNIDMARTEKSYNNYYGLLSYCTNQTATDKTYNNDDAFRGSIGYSIVNTGTKKYNQIKDFIDGSSYDNNKMGTSFVGMKDEIFASVTWDSAHTNANPDYHTELRNADGSVNMGDMLRLVDEDLLKFGKDGEAIGCTLNKTKWEDYDHYEFSSFVNLDKNYSDDYINCKTALEALTVMCNPNAVFQDVNLLEAVNGLKISWSTSNDNYITKSDKYSIQSASFANAYAARVVRDREKNVDVTLTASVTSGEVTLTKDITLTLIKENPGLGEIRMINPANNEVVELETKYICSQYQEYSAPAVVVTDINSYSGNLLNAGSDYELEYTYMYATSATSQFYKVSDVYTSIPGVYKVTVKVNSKHGDEPKSASYIVYVVSTSAKIDLIDKDNDLVSKYALSSNIVYNVCRDGVQVQAVFDNILGDMFIYTSANATETAETVVANGEKFEITDEYLSSVAKNDNSAEYYVHVVIGNKDGDKYSTVYSKKISTKNISTCDDFFTLATESTDATTIYMLTADLDFSSFDNTKWDKKNSTKEMKGLLNGNGHTVSNISVSNKTDKQCNIFYKLNGGTIMNIKFSNIYLVDNPADFQKASVKDIAVVGQMAGGYIHNVTINNITAYGKERVAALVGQVCGGVNYISNVTVTNDNDHNIGCLNKYSAGIVGNVEKDTQEYFVSVYVANCYVNAVIGKAPDGKMRDSSGYTGGIIGRIKNAEMNAITEVTYCYFNGVISTTKDYSGGIVGGNDNGVGSIKVTNCVSYTIFHWKADDNKDVINVIDGTTELGSQKNDSPVYGRLTKATGALYFDKNFGNLEEYNSIVMSDCDDFKKNILTKEFWQDKAEFDLENVWIWNEEAKTISLR